jgi:hypothetical protein
VNPLSVNPVTGFLESSSPQRQTFDSDRKLRFIQLAQEHIDKGLVPDIPAISKVIGITSRTFYNHKEDDPEFREKWEEIENQLEAKLVGNLWDQAKKPNCVAANIFLLKNWVPQRYSDNPGMNQNRLDFSWIKQLADVITVNKPAVIEAEVVITSTPKE